MDKRYGPVIQPLLGGGPKNWTPSNGWKSSLHTDVNTNNTNFKSLENWSSNTVSRYNYEDCQIEKTRNAGTNITKSNSDDKMLKFNPK